jgi:MazG family protein
VKRSSKDIGEVFKAFVAIQTRLRAPGGCPWDREQTHATLRTYLIEEAYEVLDAIESGNPDELAEELGDLLLQVLFHADIAREAGVFDLSDVISGIHEKMVRRHPHVFRNVKAETSGEVLKNWAQLKAKEKQKAQSESVRSSDEVKSSALDGVPQHLPALLEAYQLTRKAAHVGFDWDRVEGVLEKLEEEIAELRSAISRSERGAIEEEFGDLLFSAVNLARFLRLDPEVTLKQSNRKFKARFQVMERIALTSGRELSKLSMAELEQLWAEAKSTTAGRLPASSES